MERIELSEAARKLRCHPETLRRRIRDGRLRTVGRGAHGEYLISASSLAGVRLNHGGRPRKRVRRSEARASPERLLRAWWLWGEPPMQELVEATLADPDHDPDLSRFLDFRRLLLGGVAVSSAARRLGLAPAVADKWATWGPEEIKAMLIGRLRQRHNLPHRVAGDEDEGQP